MRLEFEKVNLPLSAWEAILNTFEDRTIFQTPAWLSFVAKTQDAEPVFAVLKSGTSSLGCFSGLIVKKFGFTLLGSPFPGWTTSYMGMNLLPGVSRPRGLQALLRLAFEALGCVHVEIMDRHLSVEEAKVLGLEYRTLAGFEIDLTQSEDRLFANMTSACRRCIRKATKSGVVVEEAHDMGFAEEFYSQLCEVFQRYAIVPPYGVGRVRELIRCLLSTGRLLLLRTRDPEGRCIATGIFPAMNDTMYFWGGASRRDSLSYRPNEVIHWYAMKYWRARGIRLYDMGGGGEYKRKYGGHEIRVPWIRKSKYPVLASLRDLAQRFCTLRHRVQGRAVRLAKTLS